MLNSARCQGFHLQKGLFCARTDPATALAVMCAALSLLSPFALVGEVSRSKVRSKVGSRILLIGATPHNLITSIA